MVTKFIFIFIFLTSDSHYQDIGHLKILGLTETQCATAYSSTILGSIDADGDLIVAKTCIPVPMNL